MGFARVLEVGTVLESPIIIPHRTEGVLDPGLYSDKLRKVLTPRPFRYYWLQEP